jgi:hypothetical protein
VPPKVASNHVGRELFETTATGFWADFAIKTATTPGSGLPLISMAAGDVNTISI